jgi:hypothetical protein
MDKKTRLFFGGVPTTPDVNRLEEAYGRELLTAGTLIPYVDVTEVINEQPGTSRFKSVTHAWRKKMETDYNIIIDCEIESQAFIVLTEGGKVELSRSKLGRAVKAARRSYVISARVDLKQLTDDERKAHDFNTLKAANVIASGQLRNGRKALPEMTAK